MAEAKKNLKQNYLYSLLQQAVTVALPLVTVPYLSRVLGPKGLGIVAFSGSIVQYFILFGGLGLALYGNRAVARVRDDRAFRSQIFWEIFTLRAGLTLVSLFCFLAALQATKPSHIEVYLVQSVLILAASLDISWLYMALEDFRKIAIRNITIRLFGLALIFLLVRKPGDFAIYATVSALTEMLGQAIYWVQIGELVKTPDWGKLKWGVHLRPTLALFLPQLAIQVYVVLDKTMLGLLSSVSEVAIYAQPERIIKTLLMLITTLGTVMLPRMSHLYASGKQSEFEAYARKSLLVTSYGTFLFSALTYVAGSRFIPLFLGPGFLASARVFQILSPIMIFIGVSNVLGIQMLIPMGKERVLSFSVIAGALANFSGNLLLIPCYGASGAAFSTLAAEFLVTAIQVGYLWPSGFFRSATRESRLFLLASSGSILAGLSASLIPIPQPWAQLLFICLLQTLAYVIALHFLRSEIQVALLGIIGRTLQHSKVDNGK